MSDEQPARRWVCRDGFHEASPYVEAMGHRPFRKIDKHWKVTAEAPFTEWESKLWEAVHPGIHLDPGEGPVELVVTVAGDESELRKVVGAFLVHSSLWHPPRSPRHPYWDMLEALEALLKKGETDET